MEGSILDDVIDGRFDLGGMVANARHSIQINCSIFSIRSNTQQSIGVRSEMHVRQSGGAVWEHAHKLIGAAVYSKCRPSAVRPYSPQAVHHALVFPSSFHHGGMRHSY